MAEREWLPPDQWYASLPALYGAAGGLITDEQGRVLLVQPNYRPFWSIPGGIMEADESPHEACAREVAEEVGLQVTVGPLLVVDWMAAEGNRPRPIIYFMFDCGVLPAGAEVRLQESELDEYVFVPPAEGAGMMNPRQARRLPAALQARESGRTHYLPAKPAVGSAR